MYKPGYAKVQLSPSEAIFLTSHVRIIYTDGSESAFTAARAERGCGGFAVAKTPSGAWRVEKLHQDVDGVQEICCEVPAYEVQHVLIDIS